MLYRELRDRFIKFNREHPNATPLKGFIVFSAENWPKTYSEKSRTYEVHSDNKAFRPNASSCSLFGSSLDGTDQGVRLDWYMADFGIPGGWAVERCIIKEPITRVDFTPNDIEAVYDEIDRRIDAEIRDGDFTDEKGEIHMDAVDAVDVDVSADTTDAVNQINGIQDSVTGVEVPVSAKTDALMDAYNQIADKATEIQGKGIYGDEAMIAAGAEFATYFTDTDAITKMMDTLSDYAIGMSGGGALDSTALVDYATGLGKIMTGAYDAMTKKGFEFSDAQKAIINGTATQAQIVQTLGAEYGQRKRSSWHVTKSSGKWNNGTKSSPFYLNLNNDSSNRNRNIGRQLVFAQTDRAQKCVRSVLYKN